MIYDLRTEANGFAFNSAFAFSTQPRLYTQFCFLGGGRRRNRETYFVTFDDEYAVITTINKEKK